MLTATDIMAAKVIVQLGYVPSDDVRAALRALDKEPASTRDLVNRLFDAGRLAPKQIEVVRHRVALYEHVRGESSYVRSLERSLRNVSKQTIAELIAGLEKSTFRRRLGEILVKQGKLTPAQDALLVGAEHETMSKDDQRVLDRYRKEDFAGVARGLIPNSKLDPSDFKISTLFRSKETRALVDKAELKDILATESQRMAVATATGETVDLDPDGPETRAAKSMEERVRSMTRIGDYSIIEVLGIGGMGAVFLAQRDGAGTFVAVKMLLNEKASPDERARFQREIELTPTVKHQNVISLIDLGATKDGITYLVVPALAGKELRAYIEASPNGMAPEIVVRIFTQLLAGMQAVQDAGVVHRDLKPENVFILAGGQFEVRIMDFGLAKRIQEQGQDVFKTMAGEIVGSPAYIAPETVQCDPVDHRTDLYSVGIMLFECLTGKRPIDSVSAAGYLTAHMVAPPLTLAEAAPERKWPDAAEKLIARLLEKSRDERPARAAAALAELEAVSMDLVAMGLPPGAQPPDQALTKRMMTMTLLGRLATPSPSGSPA